MSDQPSDQQLVEWVQQGHKRAFDMLVAKYQHKLMNLVSRYIKDADEVMDVTQEAFIKAYRAIGKFRGESAFYTWIYRIAISTAKNHIVADMRRPSSSDIDAADAEHFDGASGLKEYATPERLLLKDEIAKTIYATIDQLPEELRVAITLREMEGLSYEDIAIVMDCPVGTVRSRIFRARETIDAKLKPLLHD